MGGHYNIDINEYNGYVFISSKPTRYSLKDAIHMMKDGAKMLNLAYGNIYRIISVEDTSVLIDITDKDDFRYETELSLDEIESDWEMVK